VPEFLAASLEMMIKESSANVTGEPKPIGDGITDMITQAMDPHPVRDVRVPTGIVNLDCAVGGLLNEQMNMIVGRPDSGKTTVISEIALGLATRGPVLWFSLEETIQQLQFILTSKLCGIPYHNLQMGRQTAKEIVQAASWVAELPITIERQRLKTDAILQRCMAFKGRVKNVAGVIIDHAALIPTKDAGEFRGTYNMFTDLSAIPGRIGCPLVVAHQLNRQAHGRRPEMRDLRDAGEEPAKMIIGLYRDCVYNQEADPTKMELIVMKNKGPKGTIEVDIDVTCARFL
jgi:replicative DNA helicase